MSRDQGGSYVINPETSVVTLKEQGGSEALVNGRAEDDEKRRVAEQAAKPAEPEAAPSTPTRSRRGATVESPPAGESSGN